MSDIYTTYYQSAIGVLRIVGSEEGLREIEFMDDESLASSKVPDCLAECVQQLDEYFQGKRTEFSLKLKPEGTPFQQAVWDALLKIPYGQTTTYLEIAMALNNRKALRAVGAANGQNRIPIIIPCHRVIGSNGALIGFGGGIWRKEFLLKHEKAVLL
ncbi:methylated-DNA--[protein]-cysteine S-methyltransferase [bacterium]|nr:methylated-DNA--[protein]-cysteine S-methyltransferase [bacterium]